jgi:hypothetical protein
MAFPSTFLDIQNAVITKARLDPVNDLAKVKDWINQVYSQVCVETEAITANATVTMVAGTTGYQLPATVARVRSMFVTPAGATNVSQQPPMMRTTEDDILQRQANGGITQSVGQYPTRYAYVGINDFEVWPTPAAADVITIRAVAFPTVLSGNTDLPVIDEPHASKVLEYGALAEAGDFKGDPATQEWQQNFSDWMGRYLNHLGQKRGDIPVQFHTWGSLADTQGLYSGWGGWRG